MRVAKKAVAIVATAALAGSMVCAAPAAMAQEAPAAAQAGSTYAVMAKAKKVSLVAGTSTTLKVKGKKVTKWTTSKKSVATVSKKGKVTGKKAGTATITATYKGGKATFKVTVVKNQMSELVSLIKKKGIEQEKGEWAYSLGEDLTVYYSSDGDQVAFFNEAIREPAGRSFDMYVDCNTEYATFNSVNIASNYENYSVEVKKASDKISSLKWVLIDPVTYKEIPVSADENKALNKHAGEAVDQLNKALKETTGLQFADIGFAAFPRI